MIDAFTKGTPDPDPWDEYWRRSDEAAAHKAGGPQDEVLAGFWSRFFARALESGSSARLLDFGCGNGAVIRFALETAKACGRPGPSAFGLDQSIAALGDLRRRFPTACAVVADARRTPFPERSFDIVASQFGVEYGGLEAFEEAARLVADGGVLAAILHLRGGAMYRENLANLEAMRALEDCGYVAAARALFRAETGVRTGSGSRPALRQADASFATAAARVSGILAARGRAVAGGAIDRLHAEVAEMYRRKAAYEPAEVVRWIDLMTGELQAYTGRMSSMLSAAVDERGLSELARRAEAMGLRVRVRETMAMGRAAEPAAWVLIGDRR